MDKNTFDEHLGALYHIVTFYPLATAEDTAKCVEHFCEVSSSMIKAYEEALSQASLNVPNEDGRFKYAQERQSELRQAALLRPQHADILQLFSCVLPEVLAQLNARSQHVGQHLLRLTNSVPLSSNCFDTYDECPGTPMSLAEFKKAIQQHETPQSIVFRAAILNTSDLAEIEAALTGVTLVDDDNEKNTGDVPVEQRHAHTQLPYNHLAWRRRAEGGKFKL